MIGFLLAGAVLLAGFSLQAKENPPEPAKIKKLSFPSFKEFKTDNNVDVVVVEHHEQPVVTIAVVLKSGSVLDPDGKESLADFTANLLNKGTKDKNSNELAKWIESAGGSVNLSSSDDFTTISVSILSDYIGTAYEYLQDIIFNPVFPEDELQELRKRTKTALELELSQPSAVAGRHFSEIIYGDHPYAKHPSVESVEAVTREDIEAFYKKNYVANNALVAVVGDVKWKRVRKDLKKYFGSWAQGEPSVVEYTASPQVETNKIYMYHKAGAVQTNILAGHTGLMPVNPDWPAVVTANRVLGGGADARLFMNLREDKGWTYGAYSRFTAGKDLGYFRASTEVRTEVTDSALVELMTELKRIVNEPVSKEELDNAKSYLIGNFPTTIETPSQIASQVVRVKLLGRGKKYLEEYRDHVEKIGVEEVASAMKKYLHPEKMNIVLVGDASVIYDKVKDIFPVKLFDLEGSPLSIAELKVEPADYDYDTSVLKDMQCTYSLAVPQMALGDLQVNLKRTEISGEKAFEVSSSIAGMISMNETLSFKAVDFTPIKVESRMAAGPNTMNASLTCEGSRVTGNIKTMQAKEAKSVDKAMVEGAIFSGELEYALSVLPLEVDKTYKFPVFHTSTGGLSNVQAVVAGEEKISVTAGDFAVYKVSVKQPEGESFLYLTKDLPHIMIKQEMPAQGLTFELKKIAK